MTIICSNRTSPLLTSPHFFYFLHFSHFLISFTFLIFLKSFFFLFFSFFSLFQYLVRALCEHGAVDAFLSALIFVLATISDAITESKTVQTSQKSLIDGKDGKGGKGGKDVKGGRGSPGKSVQVFSQKKIDFSTGKGSSNNLKKKDNNNESDKSKTVDSSKSDNDEKENNENNENNESNENNDGNILISIAGRCALHSLPYMLILLRKLVQRDYYLKSPITASMTDLSDEIGEFQMHELLYKMFHSVSKCLLPAVRSKLINQLPGELQQEWFGIIGDLVTSLQAPLPPVVLSLPPPGAPQNSVSDGF